ncbi:hypothetical protein AYO44_12170 [Planctomycetaceae bacterium SCGC AG-212-F19]|nr:hypothetical protein AYO44_12170 [Planctomycetaceae bacterium SCGC AG-212-F19]
MTRRRCLWACLTLLLVAALFALPSVHWRVIGWFNGEAFFQGRPTSYWSKEIHKYNEITAEERIALSNKPKSWIDELKDRLGLDNRRESDLPAVVEFGPHADSAAVPVLVELLEDSDVEVCAHAASTLGAFGELALPAVPALIKMLGHPDVIRRRNAAGTLLAIGPEAKIAIPALIQALHDSDELAWVNNWAANALRQFGPEAKEAVPTLVKLLHSDRAGIQVKGFSARTVTLADGIASALKQIDPEAAAKAGVK